MIGTVPSTSPTRKTASHSRPFAECSEASVTPSTGGACCASARAASSATNAARPAAGSARRELLGQPDDRPQRLPAVPRRAGRRSAARRRTRRAHRTSVTCLGQRLRVVVGDRARPRRAAARTASRTSGRSKNRWPPRRTYGMPACGQRGFVDLGLRVDPEQDRHLGERRRPARCSAGDPRRRPPARLGRLVVVGVEGRLRAVAALRLQLADPAITRLARPTTWVVER